MQSITRMDSHDRARFANVLSAIAATLKRAVAGDDDPGYIPTVLRPLLGDALRVFSKLSEGEKARFQTGARKHAADDEIDDGDVLRELQDRSRTAFEQGKIPRLADGPNSRALLDALIRVGREQPRIPVAAAYQIAFSEISDGQREGVIEEERAAIVAEREQARVEEAARQARSATAVGKGENMTIMTSFAKATVDQGRSPGPTRQDFEGAIAKRAAELFPRETSAKAFTRAMTEDPDGRLLYAASKIAPPDLPKAEAPRAEVLGPAAIAIKAKADEYRKANPGKSPQQAFTKIYLDPAYVSIKQAFDLEQAIAKRAALSAA